jgi:4-hydroxybenzoate polyprenyltransferase/phosphoserine phosphatase
MDQKSKSTLIIDLDGTLIKTDLLFESAIRLIKKNPFYIFLLIFWLLKGRANLKDKIASRVDLRVDLLPYRSQIIDIIRSHQGKKVLATASNYRYAKAVADHLGIFDEIIASDAVTNLKGKQKAKIIIEKFGTDFEYIGDSEADIPIWQKAQLGFVINPNNHLQKKISRLENMHIINDDSTPSLKAIFALIRIHQWSKNILLFLPLIGAHELLNTSFLIKTLSGFFSFSLCASSVYILNDLLDLEEDRSHKTKKLRSLASGQIKISTSIFIIPTLMLVSILIALSLNLQFLIWLFIYYSLTFFYTILLKRIVILDTIILTGLYIIRIISGAAINNIKITFWFLAFAVFLFFSLAIIKRFVEVNESSHTATKRGYEDIDISLISISGITSSYISILIMMLYLYNHSNSIVEQNPILLLILCFIMLYGYSRIWLFAYRKKLNDDPVVFILKDKISMILGLASGLIVFLLT